MLTLVSGAPLHFCQSFLFTMLLSYALLYRYMRTLALDHLFTTQLMLLLDTTSYRSSSPGGKIEPSCLLTSTAFKGLCAFCHLSDMPDTMSYLRARALDAGKIPVWRRCRAHFKRFASQFHRLLYIEMMPSRACAKMLLAAACTLNLLPFCRCDAHFYIRPALAASAAAAERGAHAFGRHAFGAPHAAFARDFPHFASMAALRC